MTTQEIKNGDLVLPGQKLGVIEMYVPGEGTYTKNGAIYASIIGEIEINDTEKKISVIPKGSKPSLPKKGDIVVGQISMVRKQMAIADITNKSGYNPTTDFEGMIHISQVSRSYLETLSDAFKVGDIIRAVVINDEIIPFFLNTAAPHLGVILAYCSECGSVLQVVKRRLQCPVCNNIEKRKFTPDYGKATI
ncbi:MAG: exosome complex RNA-binding protein Csl4 [Candidatus Helarchaeota archaeon]